MADADAGAEEGRGAMVAGLDRRSVRQPATVRILNVADDVTCKSLAAMLNTFDPGRGMVEPTALIAGAGWPRMPL